MSAEGAESPAPDWYDDPGGSGGERWWDGSRWTARVRHPQVASEPHGFVGAFRDPALVRRRIAERSLRELPRVDRWLIAAMMTATALAMIALSATVLGGGPLDVSASPRVRAVAAVLIFAALTLATAVLAGAVRAPAPGGGLPERFAALGVRLLPSAGLILFGLVVVMLDEDIRTDAQPVWVAFRAVLWLGFGISCVYVLRRPSSTTDRSIHVDRALRIVLPGLLLVVPLALPMATGYRTVTISLTLKPILLFGGYVGLAVATGLLASLALRGLEDTRSHGDVVARFVGTRKSLILGVVAAKVAVLFLTWLAYRVFRPDSVIVDFTGKPMILATVTAMIVIVLFVIDSRISISVADHATVTRFAAAAVGAANLVGFVVAVVVILLLGTLAPRFPIVVGLGGLLMWGFVAARWGRRGALVGAFVVAAVASVATAFLVGSGRPLSVPEFDAGDPDNAGAILGPAGLVLIALAIGVIVWIVRSSVRRRAYGWLTYLVTVLVWITAVATWGFNAIKFVDFDIVLTVFVLIAAVLLVMGAQRSIDRFEIVMVVSVTTLLIEGPMIVDLLPQRLQPLPVLLALLGPGIAVTWSQSAALADVTTRRSAAVRIATTTLIYSQLAGVIWLGDTNVADYLGWFSSFALCFMSIPLLLLLIAAHNPDRAAVASPASTDPPRVESA